ncbi:MAG TPA: nitroreductase family protein, partial [Salinivirgaceae bacterium]|nr:nitroreductase family protein [Salinivirgaceae bacterium]
MLETISKHRSIRKFKPDAISDSILTEILEAGTRASNTGNMQLYSVVVTKDKEIREKLWETHFKQNMVLQAPVHITICADVNRFHKWCELNQAPVSYDNFFWFINATIDATLASQNICLEAENNGLGICILGTVLYNVDKIIEILELPKGVIPLTAIVLGYPDENPPLTDRLPLDAVVHYEKYKDYSPEVIEKLFFEKDNSEFY